MQFNTGTSVREVQKIQIDLLNEFDRLCKKHNIKYQLFSGTLLGAVRHNGFIPWDDDIDVCMLREEYDKLIEIYKDELGDSYFLQNYNTDEASLFHFSKLIKNNTILKTKMYKDVDMNQGIFIDIFPMDNVKPFSTFGKIHGLLYRFGFNIISSMNKNRCYIAKNKIVRYMRLSLYYISKLVPKKFIHQTLDKIICMFNKNETEYVACITNGESKEQIKRFTVKRSTFDESIEWEFEGFMFPIPKEYDCVLNNNYGEYMTPPPLEAQKPHHGVIEVNLDTNA